MYPYLFQAGKFTVASYGLMLAIAYLTGRWYFLKNLKKTDPKITHSELLIILFLILGVIGAKLMFIIKNPQQSNLLLSGEGFSSQGAILGAMLAALLFAGWQKVKLHSILDASAPAAILAYALARVGCFLAGDDCYGIPSDLPWAMSFPNGIAQTFKRVHPVPLYEIFYSVIIFIILMKRQKNQYLPYSQFFMLLGLWGGARFLVEFVSRNEKIIFSMSGSQLGALLMLITSGVYFATSVHQRKQKKT